MEKMMKMEKQSEKACIFCGNGETVQIKEKCICSECIKQIKEL